MSKFRTVNVAELAKQAGFEPHEIENFSKVLTQFAKLTLIEAAMIAHEKGKATFDTEDVFRGQHKAAGCYSAEAAIARVANHIKA